MEKQNMLYEGKAKQVYACADDDKVIIYFKDDATAFNAEKKGSIQDKGIINNAIATELFKYLESQNIKTHFIQKINDREQLCKKLEIFQLEFIVRNIITGSMAKRLGIKEGTKPDNTILEICYKNDDYGDPLINNDHAVAMELASYSELEHMYNQTKKINTLLTELLLKTNMILVDFKIEFGKDSQGNIVLADEITPDTCRLWDVNTGQKLDKDRFRQDLGSVEEAYLEVLKRIQTQ